MAQKKKRKHINFKRLKQEKAEHKNNFFKKIRDICSLVDCDHLFKLIPREELEIIYHSRSLAFKTIAAEGCNIPAKELKEIHRYVVDIFQLIDVDITDDGKKLSIYMFFTIGICFFLYLNELKKDSYRDAGRVKEINDKFKPLTDMFEKANDQMHICMLVTSFNFSEINSCIYWMRHEFQDTTSSGIGNKIILYCFAPEKIHDYKDNVSRPATRICWGMPQRGIVNFNVVPDKLGLTGEQRKVPVKLYIQSHALQRLKERLDCLTTCWYNLSLLISIAEIKVHRQTNGIFFIEYRIDEINVGYFVADLQDDKLIIRTFLFLTQNGTPEGDKLAEMYKLGKLDKSYLAMDRLSTFVKNDMCSNRNLSEIFQLAGCQYLLDIYASKKIKTICTEQRKQSNIQEIVKYLGLDKGENEKGASSFLLS